MTAIRVDIAALPLFPLQAVLFPGGLLHLKVFETRYLDLVSRCLRDNTAFAVMCLRQGSELRHGSAERPQAAARRPPAVGVKETGDGPAFPREPVIFETIGVLARLREVDAQQTGILRVGCVGGQRVRITSARQQPDGLWLADATPLDDDKAVAPPPELAPTVAALSRAIASIRSQGQVPFIEPYQLNDACWVANRWCEILPISLAAKQRLMALDEPTLRLKLVDDFLRSKGVV